jgi:CHAD domain-containing protein
VTVSPGDGQVDAIEIEWQFDALDLRPAERWLASLATGSASVGESGPVSSIAHPTVIQDDLYLDTEDWRIAQAGYVLRVRTAKSKREVTLKALTGSAVGNGSVPKHRREVNEALVGNATGWIEAGGPVGWRVSALIGRRPLHQVLALQTRRRPFVLLVGDEEVAEVALDETAISIDDQNPMRLLRVEVEVQTPWVEILGPLVEDLQRSSGLAPAALSKFEAGVLARGYVIPIPADLGPTAITPDTTIGALADAVVRRQLGSLLVHEAGTRLGEDIEELHDMRVATRRLRAALGVFSEILPPQFGALAPELAWLAEILGFVRDLDVQLARLDNAPEWHGVWASGPPGATPVDELRGVMTREREGARTVLLHALDSPRYERLTSSLLALAQQGAGQRSVAGHLPATVAVPGLVGQRHRAAVKAARRARRSGEPADFHRLRIRCKRLRYALEFVQEVYGDPAGQFIRRMARLQDLLGGLQDCEVLMDRLHSLAIGAQPPLSRASVFLMGTVAEDSRHEAAALLVRARSRVRVLTGDEWQRMSLVLDRLRVADEPRSAGAPERPINETSTVTPIDRSSTSWSDSPVAPDLIPAQQVPNEEHPAAAPDA